MRRAALWFALAAIGQAATLGMIDAGPFLHYQHYRPLQELAHTHPWLLVIVAAQAVLVIGTLMRAWGVTRRRSWLLSPARLAVAMALSTCTAATVSAQASRYVTELAFAAALQLLAIGTIVCAVRAVPDGGLKQVTAWFARVMGTRTPDGESSPRLDRFAWTAAVVATILAAALNVLSYQRLPHVPDEVAYQEHAAYFAKGMLTMPAAPVPAAFDVDLMEYEPGRWYSPVPPGWPAVLAVGAAVGLPWLVNPVLTGVNVLLAYLVIGRMYSRRLSRMAVILLAASPWNLFLGMSLMTHTLTLTCVLVAAFGVLRARMTGRFWWGAVAGLGVAGTSLIRPLDGVIVGALIGLWSIGFGGARLAWRSLAGLAIGTALLGAIVLPYNYAVTGDPLRFPINAYVDKHYTKNANAYGFGPDRGMGWAIDPNPGHTPFDAMVNTNLNIFGINTDLFGWGTGSLVLVAWLLCSGSVTRRDGPMIATVLAFWAAYFPYYFSGGPDFGARYWFPIIVPLVALTARGLDKLVDAAGPRAIVATGALIAMALLIYVPWRAIDKYHHFRGMEPGLRTLASDHQFGANDLVLVHGSRFPDYAAAFALNPIDLQAPVPIYVWDRDATIRREIVHAYAGRRIWLVDGPTVTGDGFRVAQGPLLAANLPGQDVAK